MYDAEIVSIRKMDGDRAREQKFTMKSNPKQIVFSTHMSYVNDFRRNVSNAAIRRKVPNSDACENIAKKEGYSTTIVFFTPRDTMVTLIVKN